MNEGSGVDSDGELRGDQVALDIQAILDLIPHRYPMLLVDRIISLDEDGRHCVGLKNVSMNEPFFQGHYPGMPIMPGVLILEVLAQVGAILAARHPSLRGLIPLLGSIDKAKFRRPVRPGDQILADVELLWIRGPIGKMRGIVRVDGELVVEMEMTFKMSRPDQLSTLGKKGD